MPAIEMQDVVFRYDNEKDYALNKVSFSMDYGSCWCLSGPNGSGKTTLFRIIAGLEFPESGHYLLDNMEITRKRLQDQKFAAKMHRKVGYVFQDSEMQLFCSSVEEEIAFGIEQGALSDNEVRNRVDQYLTMFNLQHVRHRAPFNLSGGEKKRTALASILILNPKILILDEPFNNLDEDMQAWLLQFLQQQKSPDRLILLADHHHNSSRTLADHFLYLNKTHTTISAPNL